MGEILTNEELFTLARIEKHDSHLAKRRSFFSDADKAYNSDTSEAKRVDRQQYYYPLTRETIEWLAPSYGSEFLNTTEPYLNCVPHIQIDDGIKKAESAKKWLFYRCQAMDFPSIVLEGFKDLLKYGIIVLQVGHFVSFYKPDNLLQFFPTVVVVDPRLYTRDPDAADRRFVRDEVVREPKMGLEQFRLFYEGLEKSGKRQERFNEFIEVINTQQKKDSDVKKEKRVDVKHWWGYALVESKYIIHWRIVVYPEGSQKGFLVYSEADPYENNKSPFAVSTFECDSHNLDPEGIPKILAPYQAIINTVLNLRMALIWRIAKPQKFIRQGALVNPATAEKYSPDKFVAVKSTFAESISQIIHTLPTPDLSVANSLFNIQREMIMAGENRVGETEYVKGTTSQYATPESATEYSGKATRAMERITYNIKKCAEECLTKVGALIMELDRKVFRQLGQNQETAALTQELTLRVVGKENAPEFFQFTAEDLETPMDVFAYNIDPSGKWMQMMTQRIIQLQQMLIPLSELLAKQGKILNAKLIAERTLIPTGMSGGEPLVIDIEQPPPAMEGGGLPPPAEGAMGRMAVPAPEQSPESLTRERLSV